LARTHNPSVPGSNPGGPIATPPETVGPFRYALRTLTIIARDVKLQAMFNSIRRYPRLEKAKREELETKLGDEIAPLLVESAGLHVFAVSDEKGVLTSMTVYESETAAQLAAKRAPADSSIPQLKPEETSVQELPRREGVKADAEHQRGQRKGS